ncbi:hypothetical protein FJT64_005405 [Amphibalanus amphitrite]|uniref:Uncharacterized protein n=1 Tax=Amphibalanus amphitrite TaxID=1232801 RepID=A0A6A4W017_AMPAM|nr:hypothetical protein FJT64_005405 [Amphibalanus amphitrite]
MKLRSLEMWFTVVFGCSIRLIFGRSFEVFVSFEMWRSCRRRTTLEEQQMLRNSTPLVVREPISALLICWSGRRGGLADSFRFAKETPSLVQQEKQTMDEQIAELNPLKSDGVTCQYMLQMSMIDGKVVNAITGTTSAQRCSMCGATPRNVNKLDEVRRLPVTNLEYGLSSLHCWIRIFEAAVSSCLPLSPESLEAYCNETAELYVEHYGWYPMPTTLHRLLVHAAAVVQQCLLPIGTMSEEAAEARHKHVRLYRLQRARRDSRLHTMADIFGRLMITSDPVISTKSASSRRQARASSRMPLLKEARALLAEPTLPQNDSRTSDDSSDDDSSGCDSEAP